MKSRSKRFVAVIGAVALLLLAGANGQTSPSLGEQTASPHAGEARPALTSSWSTPAQLVPVLLVLGVLVYLWRRRTPREMPPAED